MSQPSAPTPASAPSPAKQAAVFIERFGVVRQRLLHELHKVIIGQDEVISLLLSAIFARGHCLVVGVPGLAKTLLISTLARVLKLQSNRIQFTPDLMPADLLHVQKILRKLPVSDHVVDYAVSLARATRPKEKAAPPFINEWLTWGAGPRAAQYFVLGAKAHALLEGRLNVSCDDVRAVAKPVLRHRLFTNFNAAAEGIGPDQVIDKLLAAVPEPGAAAPATERASDKG
jgi:MoxR-like ATPase